jgi:N-ethylmaleimide reductase
MASNTQPLLTEYTLGDLKLKNRMVLAPMTRARCEVDRVPLDRHVKYYVQRSTAGLIITEGTHPSPQAIGWANSPGIYNDAQKEGWTKVTKAVHDAGSVIFCQLWHCGRASHPDFLPEGMHPVAPSAIAIGEDSGFTAHTPSGKKPYPVPHALTVEEIAGVVDDFKTAAQRCKDAGFDGVEIHDANGYLLDEFLQSKTNKREDQYGGSLENRTRLMREVVEAVLTVFPANRIGVRFSPNGNFNDMGSEDNREAVLYAAKILNDLDIGFIHIMDGLAFGFHKIGEPMTSQELRPVFKNTIIANCGYTRETGNESLEKKNADLICYGRPWITNPDLPERFATGEELNDCSDPSHWYAWEKDESPEAGYTDYKPAAEDKPSPQ